MCADKRLSTWSFLAKTAMERPRECYPAKSGQIRPCQRRWLLGASSLVVSMSRAHSSLLWLWVLRSFECGWVGLRERLRIEKKNYSKVSRVIRDAIDRGLV